MSLTYDEIAEIIKLIDSSSCDELVIETGDMKLVVRRNGALRRLPPNIPSAALRPLRSPRSRRATRPRPRQRSKRLRARSR